MLHWQQELTSWKLLLVGWHKFLKLSTEKVQQMVGGYEIKWARKRSTHKIRFPFFFFFLICNKPAIPKVAPGNLQTNIYTWTCRHFSACCVRSLNTLWVSGTNENLFLDTESWDDLSLFLLLKRSPLQPVPCPKINSVLLNRHHFPKLSLNSHRYNNNLQQSVKQKSAVFYPTFHCSLPQPGNMSRCTDYYKINQQNILEG